MRAVSYTRTTSCKVGAEDPPDIIKQQNNHIRNYAKIHGYKISKMYSDRKNDKNEETSFRKLLLDGIARQFDVVLVDSVYRAGQSIWSAREVLLETLCYAGIGFIVVEDDFNSMEKTKEEATKYFSDKENKQHIDIVKGKMKELTEQGIVHWSDIKYGFKLSEEQIMVIDEQTAPVVQHIFELCASGKSLRETAEILTSEKILRPLAVKGTAARVKDPYKWTSGSIKDIIRNTAYIGHWEKNFQGKVVEYTNEPIVSKELFQKAQKTIKTPSKPTKSLSPKHPFSNLIVDSQHGACLRCRVNQKSGYRYFAYDRKIYWNSEYKRNYIGYDEVESAVRVLLKKEKDSAETALKFIQRDGKGEMEAEIQTIRDDARHYCVQISEMQKHGSYDNNFFSKSEEFWENVKSEIPFIQRAFSEQNPWIQLFLSWEDDDEISNDLLKKFLTKIYVDSFETVTIKIKEEKWKEALPSIWRV